MRSKSLMKDPSLKDYSWHQLIIGVLFMIFLAWSFSTGNLFAIAFLRGFLYTMTGICILALLSKFIGGVEPNTNTRCDSNVLYGTGIGVTLTLIYFNASPLIIGMYIFTKIVTTYNFLLAVKIKDSKYTLKAVDKKIDDLLKKPRYWYVDMDDKD